MIPKFPNKLLNTWNKRNNMIICSMANKEEYINMLHIMSPTVWAYADIYNIDHFMLPLHNKKLQIFRPSAWDKIILINHMLDFYEIVMWIDCDCIFYNPWPDIRTILDYNYPMYLTRQQWGGIANTGVWVVRSTQQSRDILQAVWNNRKFINHPWWEQAALLDLMGYQLTNSPHPNNIPFNPTPLSNQIGYLDIIWNSCCSPISEQTVIKHYCGKKDFNEIYQKMGKDRHDFFWKLENCR